MAFLDASPPVPLFFQTALAEDQLRQQSQLEEQRVAALENQISQVSELLGYEKAKQKDQLAIQKAEGAHSAAGPGEQNPGSSAASSGPPGQPWRSQSGCQRPEGQDGEAEEAAAGGGQEEPGDPGCGSSATWR